MNAESTQALSLTEISSNIEAIQRIRDGIAVIEKDHPKTLVVDVSTPAGMKSAIASRAAWREPRIAVEKARKEAKAPVLKLGKDIDAFASALETELREGEANYDEQIKRETERKAHEKAEAERIEAERVAAVNARFDAIRALPGRALNASAEDIEAVIAFAETIDPATFPEDLQHAAKYERQLALNALRASLDRQVVAEAERAELAALRASQAEVAAERERLAQVERDRVAAEEQRVRDQQQAERDERIREEAAATALANAQREADARVEAERQAGEQRERDRIKAEQEAAESARKAQEQREANTRHRNTVHRKAVAMLVEHNMDELEAKRIIDLIATGVVPGVSITY